MLTNDARPPLGRRFRSSRSWAPVETQHETDPVVVPFHEVETISQDLVDAFVAEVAIIDAGGQVIVASKAWRDRASKGNRGHGRKTFHAELDFLSSDDSTARKIAARIADILSGELSETKLNFAASHGSDRRHYRLRAAALGKGRLRRAIVFNDDVTDMVHLHRDRRLLTEQLMRSEETERRRIAREMHDSTVQDLVAIGLNLKRLNHLANDSIAQEVLAEVRTIVKRTQQDVRTLSYLLHPPLLEEGGLVLALASLIRGLSSRMQICVEFETDEGDTADARLPIDIEMALYRVAQEALINVHKHASATQAVVTYHREPDRVILQVEDDGVGIGGRNASHVGSGVGIQGMRARLRQLGGELTLSTLKRGTRLKALVPIGALAAI